jgi:ketosteroid isomerase-like protein
VAEDDNAGVNDEELIRSRMTRSSWGDVEEYGQADVEGMLQWYAPDAISMPHDHHALFGHDDIRAWYEKRTGGGFEMNAISEVDSIDVVGDIAVVVGTFRVTRKPEAGIAGLDHGGRYLAVMRKVDGEWRMWRDMDTRSPDADKYYDRQPRGW